ncbi:MAG TPA: DUF1684 domain-containing protein [Cyclobacteriaceae bacterium]
MKVILLILITSLSRLVFAQTNAIDDIKEFQKKINKEFSDPSTSPLEGKALKKFRSLPFYNIDVNYRVVAKLRKTDGTDFKPMKTTTSRLATDRVYGILEFTLNGKDIKIPVYQSKDLMATAEWKDYLFFPFTDLTNNDGTYGGGRYIDLRIPTGDEIVVDFNKAYNPSCAYNPKYSCPLVPAENHIDIAITAGVRYEGKH